VQLWNPATGQATGQLVGSIDQVDVNAVAFSPDGKLLASAYDDGTVYLLNPATGLAAGPPVHADTAGPFGMYEVAFSPDGTLLATADNDGTVKLWNTATRRADGPPIPADPGGGVNAVAFSPDGTLLASSDEDGTVRLWYPATGEPIGIPLSAGAAFEPGAGVAFSPDGKLLASINTDGTIKLWDVSIFANPYAALCTDVGPPTRQDWDRYAGSGEPFPKTCA
jgi:WD40 repeat protein